MKPARSSHRSPSGAPSRPKKGGRKHAMKTNMKSNEDQKHSRPSDKKKAGHVYKKVKGQDNWRPMSRSSITALENILDLSILATIALKRTVKGKSQEHLNKIKNSFLAECVELKVPPQKQNSLEPSSHNLQEETTKSVVGRKTLNSLEADLNSVLRALEKLEEQSEKLEHECSVLREQVEEEEENAKQFLKTAGHTVLNLPPYCPQKEESTFAARIRRIIPDSDSEHVAQKLGALLQKPEISSNEQVLLLQAHTQADQLFSPTITMSNGVGPHL